MNNTKVYHVQRIKTPLTIDGNWNKKIWESLEHLDISNCNGWEMTFRPKTYVKLCYDDDQLYLIYKVLDQYVISREREINGAVWQDSCVEFFVAPDIQKARQYFNLEINAGGIPLMSYQIVPRIESKYLSKNDIQEIKIANSLSDEIIHEIQEPTEWTIEVALPFSILKKHSSISCPSSGVKWFANFYKHAENNSHPHWLSWTYIKNSQPDFHLPEFFGEIEFL